MSFHHRWRLLLLLLLALITGCASVNVRLGAYSSRTNIYPATAIDATVVATVVTKPFVSDDPTGSVDAQESLIYLLLPFSIVDFPLAVALDTLLLPYDIYQSRGKRQPAADSAGVIGVIELNTTPNSAPSATTEAKLR